MRLRRHLGDHVPDDALLIEDERRSLHPPICLSIHRLLRPHPVGLGDRVVGVAEQREVHLVLLVEALDLRDRVRRDAEDDGVGGVVVAGVVAHAAGLRGASGRVRLWVKEENHALSAEVTQPDRLSVLVGKFEVGREIAGFDHRSILWRGPQSRSNAARIASDSAASCSSRKWPICAPSAPTGTVVMWSQAMTDRSSSPFAGPTATSVESPRIVFVIGATVTVFKCGRTTSRVSTSTGRVLSNRAR